MRPRGTSRKAWGAGGSSPHTQSSQKKEVGQRRGSWEERHTAQSVVLGQQVTTRGKIELGPILTPTQD